MADSAPAAIFGLDVEDHSPEVLARMRQVALAHKRPEVSLEAFAVHCMFEHVVLDDLQQGRWEEAHSVLGFVLGEAPSTETEALLQPPESWVYFIQAGEGGAIKIGQTRDLGQRLTILQNASPQELRLLVAVRGDRDTELAFHHEFRECRVRREWFAPAPELLRRIEQLAAEAATHA